MTVGLTPELLRELDLPQFEDAEMARRYLEAQAWPEGPVCVHCGEPDRMYELRGQSTRPGLYSCGGCRGRTTVTMRTVFQNTKLGLHKWLQLTAAVEKRPCTTDELADALGITQVTAWRIRKLVRPDIKRGKSDGRRQPLCYPFMPQMSRQLPEHELLRLINDAVPREIPEDRRADICQEMAISVLIGDLDVANLAGAWRNASRKVYTMHPTRWGPLSLDAPLPGTDDLRLFDTLAAEPTRWDFA